MLPSIHVLEGQYLHNGSKKEHDLLVSNKIKGKKKYPQRKVLRQQNIMITQTTASIKRRRWVNKRRRINTTILLPGTTSFIVSHFVIVLITEYAMIPKTKNEKGETCKANQFY